MGKNNTTRIYAVVLEQQEHLYVTTLTSRELDDQGDMGVEMLVRDWCDRQNPQLTFVDYAC